MKQKSKLITIIILFCLAPHSAMAAFSAVFESDPLFYKADILPGDSFDRYFLVHNSDQYPRRVYLQADKATDNEGLGEQMEIIIKSRNRQANIYRASLSDFWRAGWIRLDDLSRGEEAAYDVQVKFLAESGNNHQARSLNFDIILKSEPGKPDICRKKCGHKWKWRHWHYWKNKTQDTAKKIGAKIFR
jgi:hypothetical protein